MINAFNKKMKTRKRHGNSTKRHRKLFLYYDSQLWSSDSDDHDYEGGEKVLRCKKPKLSKNLGSKNGCTAGVDGKDSTENERDDLWGEQIPVEVLFMIFKQLLALDASISSLKSVSRVCRLWYDVALIPTLWHKLDLSGMPTKKESSFRKLFATKLPVLMTLNLSGWTTLKYESWEMLADSCPKLTCIDLTGVKIPGGCLLRLASKCTCLEAVTLSNPKTDVSVQTLIDFAEVMSLRLKSFCLSYCRIIKFSSFFDVLLAKCPNLNVFELSGIESNRFVSLRAGDMQRSWRLLRVLRLTNGCVECIDEADVSLGFPELRELSLCNLKNIGQGNDFIHNLLHRSKSLVLLDLRRMSNLPLPPAHLLRTIQVTQLYLDRCGDPVSTIESLIKNFMPTLIELDLSNLPHCQSEFSRLLEASIAGHSFPQLESLSLRATSVTPSSILRLLKHCPKLKHLDLSSCRTLPRGTKKVYTGSSNLADLCEALVQD